MLLLRARHFVALLNRLGDSAVVYAPLLDNLRLCSLDLRAREAGVLNIVTVGEYDQILNNLRHRAAQVAQQYSSAKTPNLATRLGQELPEYSRLKDAFRQAGIVQPTNLAELQDYLKRAATSNPARGEDIYYLAFDNNAIRNRLYSTLIAPLTARPVRYNLRLAKQVLHELRYRVEKLGGEVLSALDQLFSGFNAPNIFQNQNALVDRLRLLAQAEWNAMLESGNCETITIRRRRPGVPKDSDGIIIETYAQFANHPGRKVLLFSSDNDFVRRCDGYSPNLIGILVSYPSQMEAEYRASWEHAARLLYQLSVIYGRIDIDSASGACVRLYGVWRGKGATDWREEHAKITVEPSHAPLLELLKRDADILNAAAGNPERL